MGRTRPKNRKIKPPATEITSDGAPPPPVSSLLEKAQTLIVQCDYELAGRFAQRVLEREPANVEAKEMLGVIQLELGELIAAKETFQSLVPPHPDAPAIPPASAYLYLAQLSDDDPHLALRHYQCAVDLLSNQLKGKGRAVDPSVAKDDDDVEMKQNIVRALIGMVEIWMDPSYDLCDDPTAEKTCEELLNLALQTDPENMEALQALASVRMSQQRPDEAKVCLEKAWSQWKDLDLDDPQLPPIPARLSIVKLFLELSLFNPALLVLQGIISSDDQDVEAWYLEGWCFFLMAEHAQENGGKLDEQTWEDLAHNARDCLDACQILHVNQEHPDAPLLQHTRELIAKLESLGIQSSGDIDGDEDGDAEGWEDVESDDDVEMA